MSNSYDSSSHWNQSHSPYNQPHLQLEQEFDYQNTSSGSQFRSYPEPFPFSQTSYDNTFDFNSSNLRSSQGNDSFPLDSQQPRHSFGFRAPASQTTSFSDGNVRGVSMQPQQPGSYQNAQPVYNFQPPPRVDVSSGPIRPVLTTSPPPMHDDSGSRGTVLHRQQSSRSSRPLSRPLKAKRSRPNDQVDDGRDDDEVEGAGDHKESGKGVKQGACARCKSLKVRCEFKTDTDPCKRCLNGGHECVIPGRKKRRTPPKREHLLNEIQKQAEEIQRLMAKLSKLEEANKNTSRPSVAVNSDAFSGSASPPVLSPSSTNNSSYFSPELTTNMNNQSSPETNKDVEDWIAKARDSLAEFGGFIGIGGASMPKSYIVEQDPEDSPDSGDDYREEDGVSGDGQDDEYEIAVVDSDGEEWSPQEADQRRASSKRLSGSSAGSAAGLPPALKLKEQGKSVTIPNEAVPFGLMAKLSLKNNRKRGSSSDEQTEEPETGVANADFFRPSPGPDPARMPAESQSQQLPHILTKGLITPVEAEKLFKIFFDLINPSVSLVDPVLYTAQRTVYRSPFLFTAICAISSRFYRERPELYLQVMHFAQLAAGTALIGGPKNIEMCIAYILLSLYPAPLKRWEESRGWLYLGVAIRIATELNLYLPNTAKPQNEYHAREQLNRTRVWLNCFNLDRSTGSQNGKPPIISDSDYIANHCEDWWKSSPFNMKNFDIQLCCYNSELKVMAKFRSRIYNDPSHPTGLNKEVDFAQLATETDEELMDLQAKWYPILDENVDKNDTPGNFRLGLLKLAFGYARLIVLSYGFQHAFGKNSSKENPFLTRCLNAANDIVTAMVEDIGRPEQRIYIRHGPEAQSVFVAFAAAFLVKLLQPKFSAYIDANARVEIRARVQKVIDFFGSPEIAIDNRHGPRLYARFLKGLLASPLVAEPGAKLQRKKSQRLKSSSGGAGGDANSDAAGNVFEHASPATTTHSLSPPPSHGALSFDQFAPAEGAIDPFMPTSALPGASGMEQNNFGMNMTDYLQAPLPEDDFLAMQSMNDLSQWQDPTVPGMNWFAQFQHDVQMRSAPEMISYPTVQYMAT